MTVYVFRGPRSYHARQRYATLDDAALRRRARFAPDLRVKRTRDSPLGPITELERVGTLARVVTVGLGGNSSTAADNPGGRRSDGAGFVSWNSSVRIGRDAIKDHVRVMRPVDVGRLAELDAQIDAARRELEVLRDQRVAAVANAWRYGAGANPADLLEAAKANER